MPRISAPTLAEHHARRRAAVVASAHAALTAHGVNGVTPATVARGAGLARTSVYQYYPSTAALLAAAVEEMFAEADRRIERALTEADTPREQVRAYVRTAITMATVRCGPFHGLDLTDLPGPCHDRLRELHEGLARPLRTAVERAGASEPDVVTALALGAVASAARLVGTGQDLDETIRAATAFIEAGIGAATG